MKNTYLYCKTNDKKELSEFLSWTNRFIEPQIVIETALNIPEHCYRMPINGLDWWTLRRSATMKMINWNTKEEKNA